MKGCVGLSRSDNEKRREKKGRKRKYGDHYSKSPTKERRKYLHVWL